jgi:hypothetical protein
MSFGNVVSHEIDLAVRSGTTVVDAVRESPIVLAG